MSDQTSETPKTETPVAPARKSKRVVVLAVSALVLLGGGGGGAYWWFSDSESGVDASAGSKGGGFDEADDEYWDESDGGLGVDRGDAGAFERDTGSGPDDERDGGERGERRTPTRRKPIRSTKGAKGVVTLSPFVVNLAGRGNTGYLRVMMQLAVDREDIAYLVEQEPVLDAQLRSEIIDLLSQQTADALTTPDGKSRLKDDIVRRCRRILGERARVLDVLFTEFLVQR